MEYHPIKDAQGLFADDLDEWLPIVRHDKRKVHFYLYEVIVFSFFVLFCQTLTDYTFTIKAFFLYIYQPAFILPKSVSQAFIPVLQWYIIN